MPVADPARGAARVSVLLTTASTPAELLHRAIASVTAQTLTELELVVVCDGAPGAAEAAVLADAVAGDPRIVELRPGRIGRGAALNLAVASSSAPLVAIQDADDESHRRRLELQVAALEAHPEVVLLGARARRSHDLGSTVDWEVPAAAQGTVRPVGRRVLVTNPLVHTSVLVRRDGLAAVGGYDERRSWQFDHDLYLRLYEHLGPRSLALLDTPLVLKRLHDEQHFERGDTSARLASSHRLQVEAARRRPLPERLGLEVLVGGRHLVRRASARLELARRGRG